ncbi:MAG: hypothetical protein H6735_27220 [Alphaproteobacteria bacterium]|nr:hypothetical protein [Alphaproteobacteria bacterium]
MRDARWWAVIGVVGLVLGLAAGGRADGAEERPGRVRCQGFAHDPASAVDTRDGTSPLGHWVIEQEDQGWRLDDVDTDVVVKASGTVEAWTTVCVVPVH